MGSIATAHSPEIIRKKLSLYVLDAYAVARAANMGSRINTVMQTAFFALSGVLPATEAIQKIKAAILKTYSKGRSHSSTELRRG